MATNAVELTGVTKSFGTQVAVRDLDLEIPEGALYGFIGPNGSGKTTTIRMILRIFFPDRGRVVVLGRDRGDCADDRVGYLPEERGLYRKMKVRDLLMYYARLKGHRDCCQDISRWLRKLGGEDWENRKIESLSKGMAQKVQFISAIIARPKLLILDEPFSGLDPVNLELLEGAMHEIRSQGTTVIFSTHEMNVAERLCERVFMIHKGNKVLDGTVRQIQAQYPAHEVKVRLAEGHQVSSKINGVQEVSRRGEYTHLYLSDARELGSVFRQIADLGGVEHFELLRPSLHDIFVRIAGAVHEVTGHSKAS